jgi:hypothetical protein
LKKLVYENILDNTSNAFCERDYTDAEYWDKDYLCK